MTPHASGRPIHADVVPDKHLFSPRWHRQLDECADSWAVINQRSTAHLLVASPQPERTTGQHKRPLDAQRNKAITLAPAESQQRTPDGAAQRMVP
jgi:hypothetical protein